MLIIPAIDIRNGKAVMLTQGKIEHERIFSDDPAAMAEQWVSQGARRLHVIDLDGSFSGGQKNNAVIDRIVRNAGIPVQVGGGIRSMDALERVFGEGAAYAIIGTAAFNDRQFLDNAVERYGSRIIVAVDVRGDDVMIAGWTDSAGVTLRAVTGNLIGAGVETILYTDVEKDGMMEGPNVDGISRFIRGLRLNVIVSGGVSTVGDVSRITQMGMQNITGAVIGKALYTGDIILKDAIAASKGITGC